MSTEPLILVVDNDAARTLTLKRPSAMNSLTAGMHVELLAALNDAAVSSMVRCPVPANYGLDTLRFVKPVGIGDTIRARLICKRKIDRSKKDADGVGQGVVAWDVEVTNQGGDVVASYDILTVVAKHPR